MKLNPKPAGSRWPSLAQALWWAALFAIGLAMLLALPVKAQSAVRPAPVEGPDAIVLGDNVKRACAEEGGVHLAHQQAAARAYCARARHRRTRSHREGARA